MFWFKTIKKLREDVKNDRKKFINELKSISNNLSPIRRTLKHTQNVNKGIIDYIELYTKPVKEFKTYNVAYITTESRVNSKLMKIGMGIKAINILDAYVEAYRIVNENERERILEIVSITLIGKPKEVI